MQSALALIPALLAVAMAAPQGVTDTLTPTGAMPAGCTGTYQGKFEITVAKATEQKRSIPEKRAACGSEGTLVVSLKDGKTTDDQGRTGYIAANYQFQFDAPAQTGAIFNSGFSVCKGNVLALGSSKTFYQCRSGSFSNLYDRKWAPQCEPVSILAVPCGSEDTASQSSDGQVIGTTVVQTTIITALTDGQPQVITTSVPVPIYTTYVPVSEYTDGQIQVTSSGAPVSEYSDGQVQVTSAASSAPVSEYSDGQVQVTSVLSSAPVSEYSDGQVQVTSAAPVSEHSDGQVQVTATASVTGVVTLPTTTPAPTYSSASSPATSAPVTAGSSHVAAGSMGALFVGMLVAFLCL